MIAQAGAEMFRAGITTPWVFARYLFDHNRLIFATKKLACRVQEETTCTQRYRTDEVEVVWRDD